MIRKPYSEVAHFSVEKPAQFSVETNIPGLNRDKAAKVSILVPPLSEQRRIAEILSSVDEAIAATRAVIEQTKKVKQGVLERLLTRGIGHARFKQTEIGEIPEGWQLTTVACVATKIDSGWSPDCEKEARVDNEWGVLKTSAVVWEGYKPHENKRLPHNLVGRPEIEVLAGDILVTRAGPVERTGVVTFVDNTPKRLMLSDKIIRIRCDVEICDPEFLGLSLSSPSVQSIIVQKKSGMAMSQTNISQKVLRDILFALPPLSEQKLISKAVRAHADSITASNDQLLALNTAKSALMSDLLTGRRRVHENLPLAAE